MWNDVAQLILIASYAQPKILVHNQYSLWSIKLATLHSMSFFSMANFETRKKTQAISVHRKGTFHVYNECLIVICLQVTTMKRQEKKVSKFGVPD